MIKTRMMGVMLMASSIIDKRSLRRECRKERPAMDLRGQTRRKRSTLSLERLDLSSCYFLKHFKIDISQEREISFRMRWRRWGRSGSTCGGARMDPDCHFCDRFTSAKPRPV